jgi:chorismate mutase
MKWPWWPTHPVDYDAAKAALQNAHHDRPRVERVVERAERLTRRNGFGEAITKAMGNKT